VSDEFWKALPSLVWVIFLIVVLLAFGKDIRLLVRQLIWRVKSGAAVKLASFEVSPPFVSHNEDRGRVKGVTEIVDGPNTEFAQSRDVFKTANRNLFLVHRLTPSKDETQLYDVMIYLVPSLKYGSLEGVLSVEYYFGKHWASKVFKTIDRANGFSIATSAWAPFSCTARIRFTDGQTVFLHRYIDFEMGAVGNIPFRADET
jgi:hypothetical protein